MRAPRRHFAAPFVVTVVGAAGSAGSMSCNPPQYRSADPAPGATMPAPGATATTPEPAPAPPAQPATVEQRWTLIKRGDDCLAMIDITCPKGEPERPVPTCNPPPPMKYACPEGLTFERPLALVQFAGSAECLLIPEAPPCPANAVCNPPRPQPVACPTR